MMSIQTEKFRNLNTERKASLTAVSNAVATLAKHFPAALKQQAYMHKNPDNNGANDLIAIVSDEVNSIAEALASINAQAADLLAVKAGTMTVDELLAKYTAINLEEYSAELL
jgi:hypothetical protein